MIDTRHGLVFYPESRAQFLVQQGQLQEYRANELEGGKFFPATQGGLSDPFAPSDTVNAVPPADGLIASGGHTDAQRNLLNAPGDHWRKHLVRAAGPFTMRWSYAARHRTRRYNYFITRDGWNPNQVLSRAQFEPAPFATFLLEFQPFWSDGGGPGGPLWPGETTEHTVTLPNKSGYHVILAVWEVADTGMAFYQAIDVDFIA